MLNFDPAATALAFPPRLASDAELIGTFLSASIKGPVQLVAIMPDAFGITGRWFADDTSAAALWAAEQNAEGRNVYWTVNITRSFLNGKPAKADITGARFVHVDIDPPKDGPAFDRAEVTAKLADLPVPPSFVIDRGNGLQAFWRLEEEVKNLQAVEEINQRAAKLLGGDHCHNIDRLMRLPGTVNWPTKKKATMGRVPALASIAVADEGEWCGIADLSATFPPAALVEALAITPRVLPAANSEALAPLGIASGSQLFRLIMEPAGADRSRDTFAVACEMARQGFPDEKIATVLLDATLPISAHCIAQQGPAGASRAAHRVIDSARSEIAKAPIPAEPTNDFQPLDMSILEGTRRAAAAFPVQVFGQVWAKWIEATADGCSAPLDYVAASLMMIASSLIGNARRISPWQSWVEPAHLWGMIVGDPSSGKTPAIKAVTTLIDPIQEDMTRKFMGEYEEFQRLAWQAEAAADRWKSACKDAEKRGQPQPDMPAEANLPPPPACPQLMVNDVSQEKLGVICAASPKGVLFHRDELAGWIKSFGRYGGDGERALWLEAYNGGRYQIDRVKHPVPIMIPRFAVAVFGGIQPDRIQETIINEVDDGFGARFLYFWPDPVKQRRPKDAPRDNSAGHAIRKINGLELALVEDGAPQPIVLPLNDHAASAFEAWRLEHSEHPPVGSMLKAHYGKMPGLVLRLALLLEYLWWSAGSDFGEPGEVSVTAVEAAIQLIDGYFKPMAQRVFGDADVPEADRAAVRLAAWIAKEKPSKFNARELRKRGGGPGIREPQKMNSACESLQDYGWLRNVGARTGSTAGRRTSDWEVNPAVYAASTKPASAASTIH